MNNNIINLGYALTFIPHFTDAVTAPEKLKRKHLLKTP